jgi:hypothetical protein
MQVRVLITILAGSLTLAGCARWQPSHRPGPVTFDRACPLRLAPRVEAFGATGVRSVYHFALGAAADPALGEFLSAAGAAGFNVVPVMVEMNGIDTLIVHGPAMLHDQRAVDREFRAACGLGRGRIFLAHVHHNPAGRAGDVRVR